MRRLRNLFTFLVIIYMSGINEFFFGGTATASTIDVIRGNVITQGIATAIYLVAIGMIVARLKYAIRLGKSNVFIWLIALWILSSFLWSAEPSLTLRRAAAFLGSTLIGLYLAAYYDYEGILKIAGWSFLMVGLLSLAAVAISPSSAIMSHPYGWMGLFPHKNNLGKFAAFGITLFPAFMGSRRSHVPWRAGLLLACVLLVGSNSTTGILVAAFALSAWALFVAYRKRSGLGIILLVCSFLLGLIIAAWLYETSNIDIIFGLLGKDPTFTGRTALWTISLAALRHSPWIGYGFGAFWLGADYGPAASFMGIYASYLRSSDNGYVDLLLQTGVVGGTLVAVFLIATYLRLLSKLANSKGATYFEVWPIVFLTTEIIHNAMESTLFAQNSLPWILMCAIGFHEFYRKRLVKRFGEIRRAQNDDLHLTGQGS